MVIALHCKKYADEIRVLSGITNVEQNRAEYIVYKGKIILLVYEYVSRLR